LLFSALLANKLKTQILIRKMKNILRIANLILIIQVITTSAFECLEVDESYAEAGYITSCRPQNFVVRTESEQNVTGKFDIYSHIEGFWDENNKNILYFPTGLEESFPELIAIGFQNTKIKEVHQYHVKPFGEKLVYFRLTLCDVEIVEDDLFDFNPNLKLVGFDHSNILHIGENAMENLYDLRSLWFHNNPCTTSRSKTSSATEVFSVMEKIKKSCPPLEEVTKIPSVIETISNEISNGTTENIPESKGISLGVKLAIGTAIFITIAFFVYKFCF
jgi:hypothetical protein